MWFVVSLQCSILKKTAFDYMFFRTTWLLVNLQSDTSWLVCHEPTHQYSVNFCEMFKTGNCRDIQPPSFKCMNTLNMGLCYLLWKTYGKSHVSIQQPILCLLHTACRSAAAWLCVFIHAAVLLLLALSFCIEFAFDNGHQSQSVWYHPLLMSGPKSDDQKVV